MTDTIGREALIKTLEANIVRLRGESKRNLDARELILEENSRIRMDMRELASGSSRCGICKYIQGDSEHCLQKSTSEYKCDFIWRGSDG